MDKPAIVSLVNGIMPRTPEIDECITTKAEPFPVILHNVKLRNMIKVIKWYFAGISMALFVLLVEVLKEKIRKEINSIRLEKRKGRKQEMERMAALKGILENEKIIHAKRPQVQIVKGRHVITY